MNEPKKITELEELDEVPAPDDKFVIVDVSDISMSSSGTDKKITSENVYKGAVNTHAGIDASHAITSNGDGTISVPANTASFYNDAKTTISNIPIVLNASLALTDLVNNYIVADRDTGTWIATTDITTIDFVRYLYYALVYRSGTSMHIQLAPIQGPGETESDFNRTLVSDKYKRVSGLDGLSVDANLDITGNTGVVFCNNTKFTVPAITPSTIWFFVHNVASVPTSTFHASSPKINNTQYDDGTDLQTIQAGKWTINYIFRGIEVADHLYITLGQVEYDSAAEARASKTVHELPLTNHAILIGRAIVQKSAVSDMTVEGAFDAIFSVTPITSHNEMANLQGGQTSEFYHFTAAQHTALLALL